LKKQILLVEPKYYTQFPPIGLLKLSTYHKKKGNNVRLVKGCDFPTVDAFPINYPDEIYVTSLFTWAWRPVWEAVKYYKESFPKAKVWLGGLYASLYPDHAQLSGADRIHKGIFTDAENLLPDYSLVPKWDGSIIFSSRGCNRKCSFCAVPLIEGKICLAKKSIKDLVVPTHKRIIFFDNNILENPYWKQIFNELIEMKKKVDFNQGIDARLITKEVVEKLRKMRLAPFIRIAYDTLSQESFVERAIRLLSEAGIDGRKILVYTLYNHKESPNDFFERVKNILNWGGVCYPMRFEPICALDKNKYISNKWYEEQLEAIQKARRVIGYHGAFPPFEGMKNKFNLAKDFDEAFQLRTPKGGK